MKASKLLTLMGEDWQPVTVPATFAGWGGGVTPFVIQKSGHDARVRPDFDLETYANITVTKTYYVDRSRPDDTGDGLGWATAFQKVKTAIGKVDVDRVYIKGGATDPVVYEYGYGWDGVTPANRSMKLIGVGNVVLAPWTPGLSWSLVGNHYEAATAGNAVAMALDITHLDANGDYCHLTKKTSSAQVDAAADSWYYASNVVYLRTFDGRAPDASIWVYQNNNIVMARAVTFYFENLKMWGMGTTQNQNSATAKFYAKNCEFKYTHSTGNCCFMLNYESILQNCVAAKCYQGDGFHCDERAAGVGTRLALINCVGRDNGDATKDNCNGYSSHGAQEVIAIGCEFMRNFGPNWRDVDTGAAKPTAWLVGCNLHDPVGSVDDFNHTNFASTGPSWLDSCQSSGAGLVYDLYVDTGGTINIRNFAGLGLYSGTPVAY